MNVEEIPSYLQERFQTLKAQLFPQFLQLEISDQALRGVLLKQQGLIPELVFDVSLPAGICVAGQPQQVLALGDFLGDLLLERNLLAAQVVAVLPAEACRWRVLDFSFKGRRNEEIEQLRQLNPELNLGKELNTWALALEPLGEPPGAQSLLVAAPRALVAAWQEVFAIAGVALRQLIPAQVQELRTLATLECPGDGLANDEEWFVGLAPKASRLWLVVAGVPQADWPLPGWTPGASLAGPWQVTLDRCRQFWQTQLASKQLASAQQGAKARERWCCYGPGSDDPSLRASLQAYLDPISAAWVGPNFLAGSAADAVTGVLSRVDLLQEQRSKSGSSINTLLQLQEPAKRGAWVSAGLLTATVLAWGGLLFLNNRNRIEVDNLLPFQAQVEVSQARLQGLQLKTANLNRSNLALAGHLVAVQSGSALLAELKRRTPVGVQLTALKVDPSLVRIQGSATDPQAFIRINALELALQDSDLFQADGVRLLKASRTAVAGANKPPQGIPPVQFELTASVSKKPVPLSVAQLQALGSLGMAQRQALLRREGLLP